MKITKELAERLVRSDEGVYDPESSTVVEEHRSGLHEESQYVSFYSLVFKDTQTGSRYFLDWQTTKEDDREDIFEFDSEGYIDCPRAKLEIKTVATWVLA